MLSRVLCSKMFYRVPIVGLEDLKDRVRTCWASLDQQLINKAIDPSVATDIENCS